MHAGWRDELLPVVATFSGKPALLMERAAMPLFGFKAYGVHVNGFVRDKNTGEVTKLWVAKRAKDKSTFPGAVHCPLYSYTVPLPILLLL